MVRVTITAIRYDCCKQMRHSCKQIKAQITPQRFLGGVMGLLARVGLLGISHVLLGVATPLAAQTVIHAGSLIDVESAEVLREQSIVVADGRVLRIESG